MAHSNRKQRSAVRRSKKLARKATWATLIGTSRNKKAKQAGAVKKRPPAAKKPYPVKVTIKGKVVIAPRMFHAGPECGNTGCKRCSP